MNTKIQIRKLLHNSKSVGSISPVSTWCTVGVTLVVTVRCPDKLPMLIVHF